MKQTGVLPAFPNITTGDDNAVITGEEGLTKREYAIIHIMAGILANPGIGGPSADVAKYAAEYADAALARF